MGVIPAAAAPYVQHLLRGSELHWGSYVVSAILTYVAFFLFLYLPIKALLLLISRDKRLEILELRVPQLELALKNKRCDRFEEVKDDADFLWITRTENNSGLWKQNRLRWMMYAVTVVADYCGIDKATAEKQLFDCTGMDSYEDTAILQRHMANLKTIRNYPRQD